VTECCDTVRPLLNTNVELRIDVSEDIGDIGDIASDGKRLRQILLNLLGNAVKFTEAGHVRVQVVLEAGGNGFVISVSDTGPGIPAGAIETIFDEFQQVPGTAPKHKGTGLGLSITKSLTQLLGGSIEVESEWGKGTTFVVHLPIGQGVTA
jgi:signal transduction histidine kinase